MGREVLSPRLPLVVGLALVVAVPSFRPLSAAEVPAYQGPVALAASHDGRQLYVACADSGQVAWVNLADGRVVRRANVPGRPSGLALAPDGRRLVVTCAAPRSLAVVFETESGTPVLTIALGHTACGPSISPDGRRLYVANRFQNEIVVVDLSDAAVLTRVGVVREPIATAITPDGKTLLVANHLPCARTDMSYRGNVAPMVTWIDTRTWQSGQIELSHGATGLRSMAIAPDGRHAYVTHLLSNFEMVPFRVDTGWINVNCVSIIDLHQRRVARTIGLDEYDLGAGNPWDVVCTPDGKWVAVSIAGTGDLAVIEQQVLLSEDARTMSPMMAVWPIYTSLGDSLWRRIKLPGAGPRGLAAAGQKIVAGEYFSDTLAVADLAANETFADDSSYSESRPGYAGSVAEVKRPANKAVRSIALGPPPKLTEARRGEILFHDATICYQHWQSCASCHPDARVDGLNWDLLNDGTGNPKNTKSMLLAHRTPPAMAEAVRMSAEDAVRSGIEHVLFSERPEAEAVAIDTYLKSLTPVPSPHLIDGHLSPAAERGKAIFSSERIRCNRCHPAPLYTDLKAHDVHSRGPGEYANQYDTPTLVEVWRTAPYLHNGRYVSINELLAEGRHGLPRGVKLSANELRDLVEYVLSL